MKGDFSRDTFDRRKRYSGVLMQQGRVQLDADWNEQLSIQLERTHTEAVDVIGQCGVPRGADGFRIEALGTQDLSLSPGRIYVGGLLCELEGHAPADAEPVAAQPSRVRVSASVAARREFRTGRWVEIYAAAREHKLVRRIAGVSTNGRILTLDAPLTGFNQGERMLIRRVATYMSQPDNSAPTFTRAVGTGGLTSINLTGGRRLALDNGLYLAYLHAWQHHVTALDDPQIREKALGGPDTATRIRNVWQVNLLRVNQRTERPDCSTDFPEWRNLIAPSGALMNARVRPTPDDEDPCTLPPQAGYRRLENQLYRVEVHRGGGRGEATFKWSRENGSVQTKIVGIDEETVTVAELRSDEVLGFASDQWVEVVDDAAELGLPATPLRPLMRVTGQPDFTQQKVTLSGSVAGLAGRSGLKLRRWEQRGDGLENGIPLTFADGAADAGWINLEGGVQVSFSGDNFQAGDYWLIPARTATGQIEWPPFEAQGTPPVAQPPRGIRHHYCRLALVRVAGEEITVTDCRDIFPPLTDITARDVSFDNTACLPELENATNVQEAIEELCRSRGEGCTFVVTPGEGWERVFERIDEGADAHICFSVGRFMLTRTVRISGKGHLKLTGSGPGTHIVAADSESALAFIGCKTVTVRDLYAETGAVKHERRDPDKNLNGTLTFVNCEAASVEHVTLKCGADSARSAACVAVKNDDATVPRRASVMHCVMNVGHRQQGVLLIDMARAYVENNVVRVYAKPQRLTLSNAARDERLRAELRRTLISSVSLAETQPVGRRTNVTLRTAREGGPVINFRTPSALRSEWARVLRENQPVERASSQRALIRHVRSLADRIVSDEAFRNRYSRFGTFFGRLSQQDRAVASQGITVAGRVAEDVRVLNNTIEGVLQGVHVGLSRTVHLQPGDRPVRSQHDIAGEITVAGNSILIVLPPDASKLDRHGIFVGNCRSLRVENNNVRLERLEETDRIEIEGIRVWGVLGDRISVSRNHLTRVGDQRRRRFDVGIRIEPHPAGPNQPVPTGPIGWYALENVVASASSPPVIAPSNAIVRDNFRVS